MDFSLGVEQKLIQKSVREFFTKECPKDKVRELKETKSGFDSKMWKKLVKLGYLGLIFPEEYGGTEGEFLDLMIFMEELGRNITPCPFFTTVALCGIPIVKFGTDEQKKAILPKIIEKGHIWTLAQTEKKANNYSNEIELTADLSGDNYVLNGTKLFVPFANSAKQILVVARTQKGKDANHGITLFMVDAKTKGINIEVIPTAAKDCRCEIVFKDVKVPKENILGTKDKGWEIVDYIFQQASVLKAAEMSGGCQAVFDIIVNYTKERKQFNRSIASFQAIQHRLVDFMGRIEGLKFLVRKAACEISTGNSSARLNSMAKASANKIYHDLCYHSIVLHGAIGWTEEMDIGLYHLRTRSLLFDMGDVHFHKEKIADELQFHSPAFKEVYS